MLTPSIQLGRDYLFKKSVFKIIDTSTKIDFFLIIEKKKTYLLIWALFIK